MWHDPAVALKLSVAAAAAAAADPPSDTDGNPGSSLSSDMLDSGDFSILLRQFFYSTLLDTCMTTKTTTLYSRNSERHDDDGKWNIHIYRLLIRC